MASHLYQIVRQRAVTYPSAVAFGAQDDLIWRSISSRELIDLVDRLAVELSEIGVGNGDRIVFWLPNHWRTPIFLFATWKIGAIAVPFDREMNPEAGARILASVEPRLIIVGYGERPPWAEGQQLTEWWEPGSRASSAASTVWTQPPEELAAILFTSGTTGIPKGCMISHANLCSQLNALPHTIRLDMTCRLASILPLSHLFELTVGMLYPLSAGAAVHYVPSRRGPDIVRVLSEQRITHVIGVPQLLTLMGNALEKQVHDRLPEPAHRLLEALAPRLPLSWRRQLYWPVLRKLGGRLRLMASGGAALPIETQLLWERFGVRIVQGYGASECSPVIACGLGDGSTPIGSVGRPIPGVELRQDAEGQLFVRGPNVMRGYWKDPERSSEVLTDGWYATGDLATVDRTGNVTLSGRAKDLIVLPSGLNVWPQDVEDVLRADSAIEDASVIAVPSATGGVTLHAYLLPASAAGRTADLAALVARCNGHLAQHQRVASASWWLDPDFPRTAIGKVRRNLLPLPESLQTIRVDAAQASDDPVAQAIGGVARVSAVQEAQTLTELGLDSFGLVELAAALERKTDKAIGDAALSTDMTVAAVRALMADAAVAGFDEGADSGDEAISASQPIWPYTWGRIFRILSLPIDLLYRVFVTQTIILGGERLGRLPRRVIFAGTHHSFADLPLVRYGIAHSAARNLARRVVVATAASEFAKAGPLANYGRLAFGLYPLRQRGERDASLCGLARLASRGNAVLIFPQGVHAKPELERAGDSSVRFRPGIGHLAGALNATVVPFGIAGTEKMMPPEREVFGGRVIAGVPVSIKRGPLAIAFGEPICLEPGESAQSFAARLQNASYALTREAERALDVENRRQ